MAKIQAMNVFSLRFLYDVGAILEFSRVSREKQNGGLHVRTGKTLIWPMISLNLPDQMSTKQFRLFALTDSVYFLNSLRSYCSFIILTYCVWGIWVSYGQAEAFRNSYSHVIHPQAHCFWESKSSSWCPHSNIVHPWAHCFCRAYYPYPIVLGSLRMLRLLHCIRKGMGFTSDALV